MARFALGLVTGMAIATVLSAALGIRASTSDADVHDAAVAAGVSEQDLKGALNSLEYAGKSTDPYSYLRSVGELSPVPPSIGGVWQRLAACESTSNWHINSGNGYSGGLQFDRATWIRYGGLAFAPAAFMASPAQQIVVAERTLAVQGFSAWPACSRKLGLR